MGATACDATRFQSVVDFGLVKINPVFALDVNFLLIKLMKITQKMRDFEEENYGVYWLSGFLLNGALVKDA